MTLTLLEKVTSGKHRRPRLGYSRPGHLCEHSLGSPVLYMGEDGREGGTLWGGTGCLVVHTLVVLSHHSPGQGWQGGAGFLRIPNLCHQESRALRQSHLSLLRGGLGRPWCGYVWGGESGGSEDNKDQALRLSAWRWALLSQSSTWDIRQGLSDEGSTPSSTRTGRYSTALRQPGQGSR